MMKELTQVGEFYLLPEQQMDFRLCLWKPSHFPTELEIHSRSTTWRSFVVDGRPCGLVVTDLGDVWECRVYAELDTWKPESLSQLETRVRMAYGFGSDYQEFHRLCRRDPKLRRMFGRFIGMRRSCPENLFELSVITVLLQNTTVRRSRDMLDALLRLAGEPIEFDGVRLYAFCTPQSLLELGTARLRSEARVGYRDKVLTSIAEYFLEHPVSYTGHDRVQLIDDLCQIKGVGPYTAGVVAGSIFRDPREYGLDVWNSKIIKEMLCLDDSFSADQIRDHIRQRYAPCEGLVVEMLVESRYNLDPVTPIYETDDQARQASHLWPR